MIIADYRHEGGGDRGRELQVEELVAGSTMMIRRRSNNDYIVKILNNRYCDDGRVQAVPGHLNLIDKM
eukprot:6788697-Heterocapsa_arctica.AAC.1